MIWGFWHWNCADSLKLGYLLHAPGTFLFEYFILRSSSFHKEHQARTRDVFLQEEASWSTSGAGRITAFLGEWLLFASVLLWIKGKGEGVFSMALHLRLIL